MERRERAAVATIREVIEREAALAGKHDFHLAGWLIRAAAN